MSKPTVLLEFDGDEDLQRFIAGVRASGTVILEWHQVRDSLTVPARVVEASAAIEVSRAEMVDPDGLVFEGPETLRKVAARLVLEFDTAEACEEVFDQIANDNGTIEVVGGFLPQIRRMEKYGAEEDRDG